MQNEFGLFKQLQCTFQFQPLDLHQTSFGDRKCEMAEDHFPTVILAHVSKAILSASQTKHL